MGSKHSGRSFRDEDVKTVVEEVEFLVHGGYRAKDKDQIITGLEKALDDRGEEDWKRWSGMQLRNVIEEMFEMGGEA